MSQRRPTAGVMLERGAAYRIRWPDHYNRHQVDPGYVGEFLERRRKFCQMHGDFLHWEAVFVRIKDSGAYSSRFAVNPDDVTIDLALEWVKNNC